MPGRQTGSWGCFLQIQGSGSMATAGIVRDLGGGLAGEFMQEVSRSCSVLPYGPVDHGAFQIQPRTGSPGPCVPHVSQPDLVRMRPA